MTFSSNDQSPQTLADEYNMFSRLCETIARPGIDSTVVQASTLQLVNGCRHDREVGAAIRGDIHLTVVADATVNLSRFVSVLMDLPPDSAHLNGTSTTLTGAVGSVKGGSLTPGPLLEDDILSTYIEQADSMNSNVSSALQQILDAGSYSFTKSNYRETVDAPGSVFVGTNPEYGGFDEYEPVGKQLNLEFKILQSTDLVLVNRNNHTPFESDEDGLPLKLATEYIQAARSADPEFTTEAADVLEDYLTEYKLAVADTDFEPYRQPVFGPERVSESMQRFAEAHAKTNLEPEVTAEDAATIVDLFQSAHSAVGINIEEQQGTFDADIVEAGTSTSQRDRIKNLKQVIADIEPDEMGSGADKEAVFERAAELGMDREKAEHEIQKLLQKGELYHPPGSDEEELRTT